MLYFNVQVVLAGGSSRIPLIKKMIAAALPGVPLHTSLSQDEAVACGAALQAAKDKGILDLCLSERIPWSLGIELFDGTINRVIEKNTPIPTSNTVVYHTLDDNQTSLIFAIYEGEGTKSRDNKFLSKMTLNNIRKAPACEVAADTKFEIDRHGILQVRNSNISEYFL
jgi:molecular chaperone DnaK (HSP70)